EVEATFDVLLVNARWSAGPTVTENVEVSLVRPVLEAVIVSEPAVCAVTVREATPPLAVELPRAERKTAAEGLAMLTTVELSPVSRLPLAWRISAVRVLSEPEATLEALLVKVRWSAGPTVTEKVEVSLVRPDLEAVTVTEPTVWPVTVTEATPPLAVELPR